MMRRAFGVGIGLLGFSFSALAQQDLGSGLDGSSEPLPVTKEFSGTSTLILEQPTRFYKVDSSDLVRDLPIRSFMEREPIDLTNGNDLPPIAFVSAVDTPNVHRRPPLKDPPEGAMNERFSRVYTSGELGFFYGKSIGRRGGDDIGGYIIGTVGTDKIQFTAGASYEESSFRVPRFGR